MREEARSDHIAKLRSVSTRRAVDLPQKLPIDRTTNLLADPKLSELHRRLCDLRVQGAPNEEIQAANRQFRTHRLETKKIALQKWKQEWLDDRYYRTIESGGTGSDRRPVHDGRVQALFRIMPERARLAEMIASDELVTRDQTLSALQDLLSLCRRDFAVMYRPGDEPIDHFCPECHSQLPSKARDRPIHIYNCRRNALRRTSMNVYYCFFCFQWFDDVDEWEAHCSQHLLSLNFLWCGAQRYCHTIISPGICPFCLSNEQLSAAERLQAWTRNYLLMQHVDDHIEEILNFEFACPHPLCGEQMNNTDLFRQHLNDVHGLTRSQKEAFEAQRKADTQSNGLPLDVNTPRRKRRKLNRGPEPSFIAWSPSASMISPPASSRFKVSATAGRKRKAAAEMMQEYTPPSSSDAFELLDEELHNDDDTACDSLHDFCSEPAWNDSVFKCIDIPIDPAILSLDAIHKLRSSREGSEKSAAGKGLPHASVGATDRIRYENASSISTITVHGVGEDKPQPIDQTQGSVFHDENERKQSSSTVRSVRDGIENPSTSDKGLGGLAFRCPICNRDVARAPHKRHMNFSQQEAFCEDHRRREAEKEWIECGYPRIAWRRLNARMSKKTSALRDVITVHVSSFFRTELQAEIAKRKSRKFRGVKNMIAGYYGPRGQQLMWVHLSMY